MPVGSERDVRNAQGVWEATSAHILKVLEQLDVVKEVIHLKIKFQNVLLQIICQ